MNERPSLLNLFRLCLIGELKEKKYFSLLPWKIVLCLGLGSTAVYFLPFSLKSRSDYLILLTGLITTQGIMLWMIKNSMQNIFQSISTNGFSSFLENNNILPYYLFFIQYFQSVGILSLIILISSALVMISFINTFFISIMLSLGFSFVLYSLSQVAETSILLRDVLYYRSIFDSKTRENESDISLQI